MSLVIGNLNITGNAGGFRNFVTVATTTDLNNVGNGTWTYSNPTITAGASGTTTIDGYTLADGDIVLVKNQTTGVQNGIYEASATGGGSQTILTRVSYLYTGTSSNSYQVWSRRGTTQASTAWISTAAVGSDVIGTDNPVFSQFDLQGTLSVSRGGTGATSFTSGNVLVGAGTSAITATQAAPSGAFVGTTDTQTLTNKTLTSPDINGATLSLDDTTSAFNLELVSSSGLTADRNFIIDVNNVNRTLDLSGDLVLSNTLTTAGGFALTLTTTGATNVTFPTSGILANQAYVDSVAQGLDPKQSVVAATTVDLNSNASISGTITYNNTGGPSGTGQITATLAVSNTFTVDGVTFAAAGNGSRILIKDQTSAAQNGIWTTIVSGTSLTLNRADDFDDSSNVSSGAYCFVEQGTINGLTGWVLTTPNPITVGGPSGSNLTFALFTVSGDVVAGAGLSKNGNTLQVNTTGSSTGISSDNVIVRSTSTSGQVLRSTGVDGAEATWGAINLASANAVTGTLGVGNGGTGAVTLAANGILYGNGTSAVQATAAAANSVLVTNGSNIPSLSTTLPSALTIPGALLTSSPQLTTPKIADSAGGQFYNFAVSDLAADRTVTLPLLTGNDTFVFADFIQTLTNKTLTAPTINGATLSIDDTASAFNLNLVSTSNTALTADRSLTFDVSNADRTIDLAGNLTFAAAFTTSGANALTLTTTGATNVTLPTTGTLATLAGAETLTNKTLTSPIINQINDSNGNEEIIFTTTASAVNEFTVANAATTGSPTISTTGGDTNINMAFVTKGTGVFTFDAASASAVAEIRLLDNTGGEYVGIDVPGTVTSYTITLPAAVGSTGQSLRASDNAGNLEWYSPSSGTQYDGFSVLGLQVSVTTTTATWICSFAWDNSLYGASGSYGTTGAEVVFWANTGADRDLIMDVHNGTTTIGSVTIPAGTAEGIGTFSLTVPTSDVRLQFRVRKSASGGTDPQLYAIQLQLTH